MSVDPSMRTTVTGRTQYRQKSETAKTLRSRMSSASTGTERLQVQIMKNTELMRGAILLENQMKLTVNFNKEVFNIILEVIDI